MIVLLYEFEGVHRWAINKPLIVKKIKSRNKNKKMVGRGVWANFVARIVMP